MNPSATIHEPNAQTFAQDVELPDLTPEELAEARRYSMDFSWSIEDGVWIVSFPEFPTIHTHGHTVEEAIAMGEEALALVIAANRSLPYPVPEPPRTARHYVVGLPEPMDGAAIRALRESLNASQYVLAALLNVSASAVESWEQGRRRPDGAALRLLDLYRRHPELAEELLQPKVPAGAAPDPGPAS
jgi:putative transcriptional regulator